jgi:RNA polymerase sigma factor (sigma-70 family)
MITGKTFEEHWDDYKNMAFKLYLSYNVDSSHREDLIQAARIGLHRAIQTYKEDAGSTFISWIYTYMKKEQIEYINQNIRTVRIPVSQLRIEDRQTHPTENISSLDTSIYDDGEPLYSTIEYDDTEYTETDTSGLKKAISTLKPQWQIIMNMVSQGFDNKQIGEHLGISREAVRQQRDNAMKKLKEIMIKQ